MQPSAYAKLPSVVQEGKAVAFVLCIFELLVVAAGFTNLVRFFKVPLFCWSY